MKLWTCMICGCARHTTNDEPPEGWAAGSSLLVNGGRVTIAFCGVECFRNTYEGMTIAYLFPREATDVECAALRAHEDAIMTRALTYNPRMCGTIAGSIFAQREERERVRCRR